MEWPHAGTMLKSAQARQDVMVKFDICAFVIASVCVCVCVFLCTRARVFCCVCVCEREGERATYRYRLLFFLIF